MVRCPVLPWLRAGSVLVFSVLQTALIAVEAPSAMPLDAGQVHLRPGSPFSERQELHRTGYLASFDPDRLLVEYRKLAKLPAAAGNPASYPGWDRGFLRGHMAGHYLSAAARMAAATGDATFAAKVTKLVAGLAECQQALGNDGYLAAFPASAFDRLEGKGGSGGIAVPYYTYHKLLAGLIDAAHYLDDRQALAVAQQMAGWVERRLAALSPEALDRCFNTGRSRNPLNEFGGMADALTRLTEVTGDRRWLAVAAQFNRPWLIDPLVAGEDRLAKLHANTHLAQVLGIARHARIADDARELAAARAFWSQVVDHRLFATGGTSFKEWFDAPGIEVGPCLDGGQRLPPTTAEACDTQNLLMIGQQLFASGPRADYAAYAERALTNHLLTTIAPDSGLVTYFQPLGGHFRTYLDGTHCCVGTGIENTARYNEFIYAAGGDQLWVNLYIPSRATWQDGGLTLHQAGFPPLAPAVQVTIDQAPPAARELRFRIPSWVAGPVTWTLNGAPTETAQAVDGYLGLRRVWHPGDVLQLVLPAGLRSEPAKDAPDVVAVFYGPVLLAGRLGRDGMTTDLGGNNTHIKLPGATVPPLLNPAADPAVWLRREGDGTLDFVLHDAGPASGIHLSPLYAVHHERYTVYWPRSAAAAWNASAATKSGPDTVVDRLAFGDRAAESAHDLRQQEGEWQMVLAIIPDQPLTLALTYAAAPGKREIDVTVNGIPIATERISAGKPQTVLHLLPAAALTGQQNLTVQLRGALATAGLAAIEVCRR